MLVLLSEVYYFNNSNGDYTEYGTAARTRLDFSVCTERKGLCSLTKPIFGFVAVVPGPKSSKAKLEKVFEM